MAIHPTTDKALVFSGDKLGHLGIFDSSQSEKQYPIVGPDDDGNDIYDDPKLAITITKPHTRTIGCIQVNPSDPTSLYTGSYDSTVRKIDLNKGIAVEVYAPEDATVDEAISCIHVVPRDPYLLYMSTMSGRLGLHDVRVPPKRTPVTEFYQLLDKKIGGFGMHPLQPHIIATASLDRTLKLWDLRRITGKGDERTPHLVGEHESRLSVSHAEFNYAGQIATTSYDDTIKIYDVNEHILHMKVGESLSDEQMRPTRRVPHNNQTGRWVSM